MNKNKQRLAVGLVLLISCITTLHGQNLRFMRNSPIGWMSDQDQAILKQTIDAVLVAPTGTKTDWLNSATGSRGRVQVLDEHEDFGTTCRHIRMSNQVRGRTGGGVFRLCLAEDGSWRFAANASNAPRYNATDVF